MFSINSTGMFVCAVDYHGCRDVVVLDGLDDSHIFLRRQRLANDNGRSHLVKCSPFVRTFSLFTLPCRKC